MKQVLKLLFIMVIPTIFLECSTIQMGIPYRYVFNCDVLSSDSCEISEIVLYNNKGIIVKNNEIIHVKTKTKFNKFRPTIYIYCEDLVADNLEREFWGFIERASIDTIHCGDTIKGYLREGFGKKTFQEQTQWVIKDDNKNKDIIYLIQEPLIATRKAYCFKKRYQ